MTVAGRAVATAGAVVFVASLGYFAFSYLITFGASVPGPLSPSAMAWDAGLLAAFGVHHSVFARLPVRRWVSRQVSPGLERPLYVWAAGLLLAAVCALWRPLPGLAWALEGWAVWGLRLAQGGGVWLALWGAAQIDARALAGLRPPPPPAEGAGGVFTTRGPYGWVRHPMHLGLLLLLWAMSPMTTTRLLFAGLGGLYILIAIPLEERSLRAVAPDAYAAYARKVPYRLLPGVY